MNESARPNVGRTERIASTAAGAALLVRGLQRRSASGVATAVVGGALCYRGLTGSSTLYRTLGINTAEERERVADDAPTVERTITVAERAEDLEEFWRDPEQLSRIVGEVADVSEADAGDDRHRWRVTAPFDRTVEWEAQLVEHQPGERLRWESLEGAPIPHDWSIRFDRDPGGRGTTVTLEVRYDPPGGALGTEALSRLGFGVDVLAGEVLNRFKSLAETGEIPTIAGNPSGRGRGDLV